MKLAGRRVLVAALALIVAASACKSKGSSDSPDKQTKPDEQNNLDKNANQPAATGDVGMLFDAAGYDGAIGVALWPSEWSKLSTLVDAVIAAAPAPFRSDLSNMKPELAAAAPTAWSAVAKLARAASGGDAKLPDKLDGLDESRPIVASLFAPMGTFEDLGLGVIERMAGGDQPGPHASVHRFAVPTVNSHAARDALVASFEAGGLKKRDTEDQRVTLGDDQLVVSVGAAKLWVEVVVLSGERLDKVTSKDIPKPSAAATEADKLFADAAPSLGRLQIRALRVAAPSAHAGMLKVDSALGEVEDKMRAVLFMAGLSEILSIIAVADPAGTASTDVVAEVPASSPGSFHAAVVLTANGRAAFAADSKLAAGKPVALADVDWLAVVDAAPQPPAFAGASMQDAAEMFHEGGWGCMMYAVGANALSVLHTLSAHDKADAKKHIEQVLGQAGDAGKTTMLLTSSMLVIEGLTPNESRFRKASLPAPAAAAQSDSEKCFYAAMLGIRKAYKAGMSVDSGNLPTILAAAATDNKANLDCAQKDSAFADRVEAMRKINAGLAKLVGGK